MVSDDRHSTGPRALRQMIDRLASQAIGKDWTLYATLMKHWEDILGADYVGQSMGQSFLQKNSNTASPIKLLGIDRPKNPRGGIGTARLRLGVPGALAPLLQQELPAMLSRINRYFGYAAIGEIRLEHIAYVPPPSRALDSLSPMGGARPLIDVSGIEDSDLREALEAYAAILPSKPSR